MKLVSEALPDSVHTPFSESTFALGDQFGDPNSSLWHPMIFAAVSTPKRLLDREAVGLR